jgi:hypothetical protein
MELDPFHGREERVTAIGAGARKAGADPGAAPPKKIGPEA